MDDPVIVSRLYSIHLAYITLNFSRNLIKIWSDILSMISQAGYLPDLLEKLTNTEFEDSFSKRVSEAWVSRILAQVSKKTTGKFSLCTLYKFLC